MEIKKLVSGMLVIMTVFTFSGCTSQESQDRKIIEKPDKKLTILDDPNQVKGQEVTVEKVDRYEDIGGMGWLNEETVLVGKENKKLLIKKWKDYPENLYLLNLKTKEQKPLREESAHLRTAKLSPDKKHIFYAEYTEKSFSGFVMNSEGREKVQVSKKGVPGPVGGQWINNHQVILRNERNIYLADLQGKIEDIKKAEEPVFDAFVLGKKVYYNTSDSWNLFLLDLDTKEEQVLKEKIMWIIPSPNQNRLALVKWTGENKVALVLTDLKGKEVATVAEGNRIFGISWSPDQTKLAYTQMDEDGKGGIFVADVALGKSTQVAVDIPATRLVWSPSGKKLLAVGPKIEANKRKPEPVTYIISLR